MGSAEGAHETAAGVEHPAAVAIIDSAQAQNSARMLRYHSDETPRGLAAWAGYIYGRSLALRQLPCFFLPEQEPGRVAIGFCDPGLRRGSFFVGACEASFRGSCSQQKAKLRWHRITSRACQSRRPQRWRSMAAPRSG